MAVPPKAPVMSNYVWKDEVWKDELATLLKALTKLVDTFREKLEKG